VAKRRKWRWVAGAVGAVLLVGGAITGIVVAFRGSPAASPLGATTGRSGSDYDPRSYGALAEAGMASRVVRACEDLGSPGRDQS
jgi:hypothetical protein